jgi:transcriptional regulator NrdR family protein
MTCPECNGKTKVVDSRTDEDSTLRRRECIDCGYRFSTVEVDKDMYERMMRKNEQKPRHGA